MRQVEVGDLEDQRVAEDGLTADPIQFAGAQGSDWSRWSTFEAKLSIYAKELVDLHQLRRSPDVNRLNFDWSLRLNAIGGHHRLQSHGLGDQHDLHNQVTGGTLGVEEEI